MRKTSKRRGCTLEDDVEVLNTLIVDKEWSNICDSGKRSPTLVRNGFSATLAIIETLVSSTFKLFNGDATKVLFLQSLEIGQTFFLVVELNVHFIG